MPADREYVSPDGKLRFLVRTEDGDVSLGFVDSLSHTHGDILAALSGIPIQEAVQKYIDDLLGSKTVIAVLTIDGKVRDIWPTDDPASHLRGLQPGEAFEFRLWNGTVVSVGARE